VDIVARQAESISIPIYSMMENGNLSIKTVEPLMYSPDEFALMVRKEVESQGCRMLILDSVSGYKLSINGEDLIKNLHALGKYLQRMGVTVFIVIETSNILNSAQISEIGISYLSDNIIFLRYFETEGGLRKALGVLKKRMGDFEKKMRNFEITKYGLKVGEPLTNFRGIFSGIPSVIKDE
jgi:circadian clock protein KaiC